MTDREITTAHKAESENGVEITREGPVFSPAVDIYESDQALTVMADMPGVEPGTVDVDLDDDMLIISAEPVSTKDEEVRHVVNEYQTGGYYRRFRIGKSIDRENISAAMTDGVLELVLPKIGPAQPRKIEVSAG